MYILEQGATAMPRLVEALAGKTVVGAAAGVVHTAAWADAGELLTFGHGLCGMLGHGGDRGREGGGWWSGG